MTLKTSISTVSDNNTPGVKNMPSDQVDGVGEKSLSDLCFIGLAWALALVILWKNLWILQLLPILILFLVGKKLGRPYMEKNISHYLTESYKISLLKDQMN